MPKQFHVGVKGVVRVGDKCLALKKHGTFEEYFWDLPGGRINDQEEIEVALCRELKEELPSLTDYTIGVLLGVHRFDRDFVPGSGLFVVFYHVEAKPFEVILSAEHDDFRWVTLDTVEELKKTEGIYMGESYFNALVGALHA